MFQAVLPLFPILLLLLHTSETVDTLVSCTGHDVCNPACYVGGSDFPQLHQ